MNAYNLIMGAVQLASGQFSDYWEFAKLINQRYGDLPYERASVRSRIRQDIEQTSSTYTRIDSKGALNRLITRDLTRIDAELDQLPTSTEFSDRLNNAYRFTLRMLRDLGIECSDPAFFVVERFPPPYDTMDWVAFAPDRADQEDFGIEPGVYLLEGELSAYYSELTLAHELIHAVIGVANPFLLGRGLEEGIADFIGMLYIGTHLYSSRVARNVFIHSHFGSHSSQSSTLYLDYTRQASLIYRRFGLSGLAHLIQTGREAIKGVESLCLSNDTNKVSLPIGNWDESLTYLADNLLLGFIPNLVVSPLAAHISEFAIVGRTVDEIAEIAQTETDATREALEELQNRTFSVLLDKGKIVYSDTPFLVRSGSLRYELTS